MAKFIELHVVKINPGKEPTIQREFFNTEAIYKVIEAKINVAQFLSEDEREKYRHQYKIDSEIIRGKGCVVYLNEKESIQVLNDYDWIRIQLNYL